MGRFTPEESACEIFAFFEADYVSLGFSAIVIEFFALRQGQSTPEKLVQLLKKHSPATNASAALNFTVLVHTGDYCFGPTKVYD
jgi:hypothetical protein